VTEQLSNRDEVMGVSTLGVRGTGNSGDTDDICALALLLDIGHAR
jgi:hypothetical protein